jgi:hypothetical protein
MSLLGDIPGVGTVEIRESPAIASEGQTIITDIGGGLYHIDSFFDVFTELSVDGGQSWIAATDSVRMELVELQFVPLVGPAEVHTFFEGPTEGDAVDDDMNGRDEVRTEIKSMALQGTTPMGPVQVNVRTDSPTEGEIEELVNNTPGQLDLDPFHPGDANSFFDVWPKITLGGQALVTAVPVRLETTIYHKPPKDGEWYLNPLLPRVELIDPDTGMGTGICVWREIHQFQMVDSPPAPPVADAGGPYNGVAGVPVSLDGSGSSDPDGNIILYEWDFNSDGVYDYNSPTDPSPAHTYASPGVYSATLQVTDDDGLTDIDAATVTISEAPPVEVGGEVYPTNKVSILVPWIALSAAIIAGAIIAMKRRGARS